VPTARARGLLAVFVVLSGAALLGQPQRGDNVVRSGVDIVMVTATVLDAEGRLVTGLEREAFEVYEDGDRQTITQFTNERVPVGLGVLLDVSDSMFGQRIVDARRVVERFLFELLDPADAWFVLAFNHYPHIISRWNSTGDEVRAALGDLKPSGGTAIYDAVIGALPMIARRPRERAALVVISDGADTASDATVADVRKSLLRSEAFVYAIAIDSPKRQAINTRVNETALGEITNQSGGRTEVVRDIEGLQAATARIAEELNSQYVFAYASPRATDGKFHSIRVRVTLPGHRVRARNGYVGIPKPRSVPD
jgi:Ca-activated chloride channel homolog